MRILAASIGVSALLALTLVLWVRPTAQRDAARPPAVSSASGAIEAHGATASGAEHVAPRVSASPTSERPPRAEACTIEVALLASEGEEVLGGRAVTLRVGELGSARGDSRTLEGATDAQGLCRWTLDGPLELRAVRVAASQTSPSASRSFYETFAFSGETRRLELEVEAGVSLAGRVVDELGHAMAGAGVLAWSGPDFDPTRAPERSTVADGAGRFELAHLGRPFAITARAPGHVCARGLRGELPPGARVEGGLELVLVPERRVAGQVLGARNEPVAATLGVRAHGTSSSNDGTSVAGLSTFRPAHAQASTDADGRFDLGALPPEPLNVRVQSDVYGERYLPLPLEPGPWTIRLDDGVVLRGSVHAPDGAPVAGATVGIDGDGLSTRRTRSGNDGRFELRGLPELESCYVYVGAAGFAPWIREGLELSLDNPLADVVARLEPGLPLAGRVLDGAGAPVVGVRVVLEGERGFERGYSTDAPDTIEHLVDRGETHTDRVGAFAFPDLYPGEFAVRVFPRGERQLYAESRARAGTTDLELRLDPLEFERVVLRGRVSDAVTGTPIQGFALLAMLETPEGSGGIRRELRDDQGAFRLALPRPVRMHLEVEAPGYAPWTEPLRERGEGEHVYDVRLLRERSLELRFLESDGSPAGGTLAVYDEAGSRLMLDQGGLRSSPTRTDAGVVRGLGLPASLLRVVLDPGRGRAAEEFTLDLRTDPGPVVEFVLAQREAEPAPQQIAFSVFSADRDVDVEALTALLREQRGPVRLEGCEPLAAALSVAFAAADGTPLLLGRLEPTPEGFLVSWNNPIENEGTSHVDPPQVGCLVSERVSGRAREVRLAAPGHAARVLSIDPSRPNGGLPFVVVLRR